MLIPTERGTGLRSFHATEWRGSLEDEGAGGRRGKPTERLEEKRNFSMGALAVTRVAKGAKRTKKRYANGTSYRAEPVASTHNLMDINEFEMPT